MYLLDTNICIYAVKNKYPALTAKLFQIMPSEIFVSSITTTHRLPLKVYREGLSLLLIT